MKDVISTLILNIIVYRYSHGDQLNLIESDRQSAWKDAFDSCNDPTYWYQIFNDCHPGSCNASNVADTIIKKSTVGRQQYWIYGYVPRSPVIVNIGCFSLKTNQESDFRRGNFSLKLNSAFKCLMACPNDSMDHSTDFVYLRGNECLCIRKHKYEDQLISIEENTVSCNQVCDGNKGDLCGGAIAGDGLYSVYQVISRGRISAGEIGKTCARIRFDNTGRLIFNYISCRDNQIYICHSYNKSNKSYEEKCTYETASWYAARQTCQQQGLQLRSYTTTSFKTECVRKDQMYWIGNHVAETIVWANGSLPKGALCMTLVINKSGSWFETENCDLELNSLCYTPQQTSSGKIDEAYMTSASTQSKGSTGHTTYGSAINTMPDFDEDTTNSFGRTTYGSSINTKSDSDVENTKEIGRATLRGPVNAESDSDEDKQDFIPIIAGSVGGFVALVIVVIVVFIIQRRNESNNKHLNTAVDEREPETYSVPIKNTVPEESMKLVIENTIPEENKKLVNVTEEGIYNHLGDSEKMIEMKPQDSSIYDVTGDDEYHVFTGSGKQQILKDDDDLYDHGAASDVYNTLNDTVTPNRPESDTYNVINAK